MFAIKRRSWDVHNSIMNTPTTWYAFKDPKTGREYFHEPVSKKSSWVLPTSSNATRSESEIVVSYKEMEEEMENIKNAPSEEPPLPAAQIAAFYEHTQDKKNAKKGLELIEGSNAAKNEKNTKRQPKQMDRWSAVGIKVVSILLFITLCLLVLVKILCENNNGLRQIHDQIKLPVQAHDKSIKLKLPSVDTAEKMRSTLALIPNLYCKMNHPNIGADPKSVLQDEPSLPNFHIMHGFWRLRSLGMSHPTPDDATELNGTHNPDSEDGISDEEVINKENPSFHEEVENKEDKENEKGVDAQSNMDKSNNVWVAVLVKKCRQLRTFFIRFFDRLRHAGSRPASGR